MSVGDVDRVPAEVWPRTGQTRQAAAALQELGFRVLRVGATISVDGPAALWTRTFGVPFPTADALPGDARVPQALRGLILDVSFVPPPDLHR